MLVAIIIPTNRRHWAAAAHASLAGLLCSDAFFKQIYAAARQVEWGQMTTYGALAKKVGAGPEAARDVGQAMAKNPVALIIPCHRVLAAGGKVGGFSAPGGPVAKIRMLKLEGCCASATHPAIVGV